jgi:hypothetical protein
LHQLAWRGIGDLRCSSCQEKSMPHTATIVRFVGMFASPAAEAAVRECIRTLEARCRGVARWEVSLQPPLGHGTIRAYTVRAHASLADGSTVAIRSQAGELLQAVRDAFDGLEPLLQDHGPAAERSGGWPGKAGAPRAALSA